MNIITNAVVKNYHISNHDKARISSWRIFKRNYKGKKIFLFGGTMACDYYLKRYGKKYRPEYVIDNDTKKWGKPYAQLTERIIPDELQYLQVAAPHILKSYLREQVLILITSTKYYEEIAEQLDQMGYTNYYFFCVMEARRWRYQICPVFLVQIIDELEKRIHQKTGWDRMRLSYVHRFHQVRKYPIQPNKIVFSMAGRFMDHGKYIALEIQKQKLPWDVVWTVRDAETEIPQGMRKILEYDKKAFIYEMATAAVWVNNGTYPNYVRKRKGQFFIETKHWSSVTLKKFFLDAPSLYKMPAEVRNWKRNGRMMDCIITGSDFDTTTCKSGFGFDGEIWQVGSVRSDILFQPAEVKKKVYQYYDLKEDFKLLLYAPTYRFQRDNDQNRPESRLFDLDYGQLRKTLQIRFGGEWRILLRLHPSVAKQGALLQLPDFVINASEYQDSQELIAASDMMITDFSSIMFEPAHVRKPVFLFIPDYDEYIQRDYELLLDIRELPFPTAETAEKLLKQIEDFHEEEYVEKVDEFLARYGVKEDGHAAERAVEKLKEYMQRSGLCPR